MGERKGVNKWYPPDWTPSRGSLNQYHGQHPLRERAKKLDQGILVIRFEMPWGIWCGGCGSHVGRGVRYNAEKKKVGKYYTTPIYEFKMKCHLCENHFTMETDPKACDYRVTGGARRKDVAFKPEDNETIPLLNDDDKRRMEADPMFRLEHGAADVVRAKKAVPQLVKLLDLKATTTRDDYSSNSLLRSKFRVKRKELKRQAVVDKRLQAKASLAVPLVPERPEDVALAQRTTFGARAGAKDAVKARKRKLRAKSIFKPSTASTAASSSTAAAASSAPAPQPQAGSGLSMEHVRKRQRALRQTAPVQDLQSELRRQAVSQRGHSGLVSGYTSDD